MANKSSKADFFDNIADSWDDGYDGEELKRAAALIKRCGFGPSEILLEPGCGSGVITSIVLSVIGGGSIVSADFSAKMIQRAKEKIKDSRVRFICGDVFKIPLPQRHFTSILCFNCFPHFDRSLALKTFPGLLKSGGRLIIAHSIGREQLNLLHKNAGKEVAPDILPPAEQLKKLLLEKGFDSVMADEGADYYYVEGSAK